MKDADYAYPSIRKPPDRDVRLNAVRGDRVSDGFASSIVEDDAILKFLLLGAAWFLAKKLFEFPENRMRGWVAADVADILQLFDLAHDLFEAGVFAHPEPDPAVLRRRQWQAENAVHIECAAGKEPMTWDIAPGWFARVSSRMVCTVLVFL